MASPTPLLKPKLHHFFDQAGENSHRKNLTIPLFYFIIIIIIVVLKYYMGFKSPYAHFISLNLLGLCTILFRLESIFVLILDQNSTQQFPSNLSI